LAASKANGTNSDSNAEITILDVRKEGEFKSEHIVGALNHPLSTLEDSMQQLDKITTYYIHCAGGYRSMIAASLLKANGFENVIDVAGGFNSIKTTNIDKIAYVCPSTLEEA